MITLLKDSKKPDCRLGGGMGRTGAERFRCGTDAASASLFFEKTGEHSLLEDVDTGRQYTDRDAAVD